jgi:capsular polysaccharide biosynthesis protein
VTTVITRPEGSAEPEHGNLLLDLFLGLLLGLALALVVIFTREYLEAQRQRHPADYAEFASLRSSIFRSLARSRARRG